MSEPVRLVIVVRNGMVESVSTDLAHPGAVQIVIADTDTHDANPGEIARLREQGATLRCIAYREECFCDPDLVADAFAVLAKMEG